jgi:hypothetical protein
MVFLFMLFRFRSGLIVFALAALGWTSLCAGQASQPPPVLPAPTSGTISGTIVDQSGAIVTGARVKLTRGDSDSNTSEDQSQGQEVLSGDNGQFSFAGIPPGPFHLTVTSAGFAPQTSSGLLHAGEICIVPQIALAVAVNISDVQVNMSRVEVAEAQVKDEEKQRVLGIIPNFYVTYDPHPLSLTPKQKFELAWRTTVDPVTFAIVGGLAGVQQAQNTFLAMDKAHKVSASASAPPTPTLLRVRSSEAPFCHRF